MQILRIAKMGKNRKREIELVDQLFYKSLYRVFGILAPVNLLSDITTKRANTESNENYLAPIGEFVTFCLYRWARRSQIPNFDENAKDRKPSERRQTPDHRGGNLILYRLQDLGRWQDCRDAPGKAKPQRIAKEYETRPIPIRRECARQNPP